MFERNGELYDWMNENFNKVFIFFFSKHHDMTLNTLKIKKKNNNNLLLKKIKKIYFL